MTLHNILLWPFIAAFTGATIILAIILIIFWLYIIIDCARRKFKNDIEKLVWILIILLTTWLGAIVYFIVIKVYNKKGLMQK